MQSPPLLSARDSWWWMLAIIIIAMFAAAVIAFAACGGDGNDNGGSVFVQHSIERAEVNGVMREYSCFFYKNGGGIWCERIDQ